MKSALSSVDLGIAEQAARWLIEIEEGGPEVLADFAAWLKVSPVHVDEFLMVTSVWKAFDGMDAAKRVDVARLLREAKAGAVLTTYVAPGSREVAATHWSGEFTLAVQDASPGAAVTAGANASGQVDVATGTGPSRRASEAAHAGTNVSLPVRRRAMAGLAIAASIILLCAALWLANSSARTYATTTGEQRAFKLEDGSIVHLNTQSRVTVDFTRTARTVRLVEGEALFTVERDPTRPFRVEAGSAVFQAVGTQFNVYRRNGTTTISVVEGVVQILPDTATARLAAGEQANVTGSGQIDKHKVTDLEQVTAWRQRRLVFRGDSLDDVSREFNRYNSLRIEIDSPEIRAKRLTGVFNADDPESLVLFLTGDPDLSIQTGERVVHIRHRAR